jgi:TetR/AcrR family transcriptional repressor of lmrAB and yxaGH operons
MNARSAPARLRLVAAALDVLADKGYSGTGTAEILALAHLPKGSLYHAFPGGKADLALAAAEEASRLMLRSISDAFEPHDSFDTGLADWAQALARAFESGPWRRGCPISAILLESRDHPGFAPAAAAAYGRWARALSYQAMRCGADEVAADAAGARILLALQGAFVLARAAGDGAPLRRLPAFAPG